MALLDEMRTRVRIYSEMTDSEIQGEIDAALADMARVGIRPALLDPENLHPQVKHAVAAYLKASYGYDNAEAPRFMESYRMTVTALLNSKANECDGGEQ